MTLSSLVLLVLFHSIHPLFPIRHGLSTLRELETLTTLCDDLLIIICSETKLHTSCTRKIFFWWSTVLGLGPRTVDHQLAIRRIGRYPGGLYKKWASITRWRISLKKKYWTNFYNTYYLVSQEKIWPESQKKNLRKWKKLAPRPRKVPEIGWRYKN